MSNSDQDRQHRQQHADRAARYNRPLRVSVLDAHPGNNRALEFAKAVSRAKYFKTQPKSSNYKSQRTNRTDNRASR